MKKQLKSRLTVFYKIIFPAIWTLIIAGLIIFIFIVSNDPMSFLVIVLLLPIRLYIDLQPISYDDKNIYVYNWRTTKTYELNDIKAINEGDRMSFDPFFEIEVRNKNGSIEKVDFMPKIFEQLAFMFTKRYTVNLYDVKTRIINSKSH